jgi:hypothetical protein
MLSFLTRQTYLRTKRGCEIRITRKPSSPFSWDFLSLNKSSRVSRIWFLLFRSFFLHFTFRHPDFLRCFAGDVQLTIFHTCFSFEKDPFLQPLVGSYSTFITLLSTVSNCVHHNRSRHRQSNLKAAAQHGTAPTIYFLFYTFVSITTY